MPPLRLRAGEALEIPLQRRSRWTWGALRFAQADGTVAFDVVDRSERRAEIRPYDVRLSTWTVLTFPPNRGEAAAELTIRAQPPVPVATLPTFERYSVRIVPAVREPSHLGEILVHDDFTAEEARLPILLSAVTRNSFSWSMPLRHAMFGSQ